MIDLETLQVAIDTAHGRGRTGHKKPHKVATGPVEPGDYPVHNRAIKEVILALQTLGFEEGQKDTRTAGLVRCRCCQQSDRKPGWIRPEEIPTHLTGNRHRYGFAPYVAEPEGVADLSALAEKEE